MDSFYIWERLQSITFLFYEWNTWNPKSKLFDPTFYSKPRMVRLPYMFKVIKPNCPEELRTAGGSSEKNEDKKDES